MLGLLRKSKFSLEKLSLNSLMLLRDTMGISSPVWVPAGVVGGWGGGEEEREEEEDEEAWSTFIAGFTSVDERVSREGKTIEVLCLLMTTATTTAQVSDSGQNY